MSFARKFAVQDTSIANVDPTDGLDISGSNAGASQILNLYRTTQNFPGTSSILIAFQPDYAPSSGTQVVLKMFDAQHGETLPNSYTVTVRPVEQGWSEGTGLDLDFFTDLGPANWVSATLSSSWVPMTGTSSATFYFATGHEDLEVDITSMLPAPNGFRIDIAVTGDLYTKKFHSRQTHFPQKRPYIETRMPWPSGNLSTKTVYTVVSGDYSGTVWPSSSAWAPYLASGTMMTSTVYNSVVDPTGALVFTLPGLKPTYGQEDIAVIQVQSQLRDWNPAVVQTASLGTPSCVLTKMYFRIMDVGTGEIIAPFSTGTLEYTRLGYNDYENFFVLDMRALAPGIPYQIDFLYEAPTGSGNWTTVDGTSNRFRVISHA